MQIQFCLSVGGSARKQPSLNAFLSRPDSDRKGSNSQPTSGKGTSGEVCAALSGGNTKMCTHKELEKSSLLPEVWSGAKLLHQMASAPLDAGTKLLLKLLACTQHACSVGLGPPLAATGSFSNPDNVTSFAPSNTTSHSCVCVRAYAWCICALYSHSLTFAWCCAASAKGKKKVGEVIDLLDDDPGMASQDLQGSPLPVSPLRVMLAGLLLVVKCLQPSSTRLSSVALHIVILHCSCVCATHSAMCFMHCAITYSNCSSFIKHRSSFRSGVS